MPRVEKARYVYSCAKCGGSVSKTPVYTPEGEKSAKSRSGLHGWTCGQCGRGVKVKRTLRKDFDERPNS